MHPGLGEATHRTTAPPPRLVLLTDDPQQGARRVPFDGQDGMEDGVDASIHHHELATDRVHQEGHVVGDDAHDGVG